MKYPHKKNQKGFTLIETMVAITILVLATLGPLAVSSQGLSQAEFARDQVTAYYLADEAIEYIRNVVDTNAIQAMQGVSVPSWTAGLSACMSSNGCAIDATNNTPINSGDGFTTTAIQQCSAPACPHLYTDSTGTFYYSGNPNHLGTGTPSIFIRTVTMTPIVNPNSATDEYQITSTVSWTTAGLKKTFTVVENINNSNK